VLLASRLINEPKVVVLNEPTRGVDVGARLEIHRFLRDIASRGAAVLVVTSDIEEAVAVSDRLLIVRDGSIRGELQGPRKTQGAALRLATGTEE
jgi:ribose transport system ATP-binding protein